MCDGQTSWMSALKIFYARSRPKRRHPKCVSDTILKVGAVSDATCGDVARANASYKRAFFM